MKFIKNNYMKIVACLIWAAGIPASYFLSLQYKAKTSGMYGGGGAELKFVWQNFCGYLVLFLSIGFVAFILACNYHNQKKKAVS